jgi:hypothetical protein
MNQPRIFTRNTLEAIAHLRGEHMPSSPVLGETLLAFLRSRGQLEEKVDAVKAREDFQNLARHIGYDAALPPPQANEFKPFTAMRAEIAALRLRRDLELEQFKSKREQRAQEAQSLTAPPPSVMPRLVQSATSLMTKLQNKSQTALKNPQSKERER